MNKSINKNLWTGAFKEKELLLYKDLNQKDIKIILKYQKLLPVLQQDNNNMINTRVLHEQMKLVKHYTEWFANVKEQLELEDGEGYFTLKRKTSKLGGRPSDDYFVSLETAKEIVMIAGIGNRVNQETKQISQIARKYFIAIEKAFKSRYIWNRNRQATIDAFHDLKKVIFDDTYGENTLEKYVPQWWNMTVKVEDEEVKNTYAYELYLLDLVIIGMSAKEYRRINGISSNTSVRNTFNEEQLEDFELLQSKSAEYLEVNNIWNTDKRFDMLKKFYAYYKEHKAA